MGIFTPILKIYKNRNKGKGKDKESYIFIVYILYSGGLLVYFDDELTTFSWNLA